MPKLFRWLRYLRQINEFAHHTAELAAIIKFLLSPFLSPLLPFFLSCPCSLFLAPFPPPRGTTGENTGTNKRSACTSCGHKCGLRYHSERTAMALIVVNFRAEWTAFDERLIIRRAREKLRGIRFFLVVETVYFFQVVTKVGKSETLPAGDRGAIFHFRVRETLGDSFLFIL